MSTYPPNFNDPDIINLCLDAGQPVSVDGFYAAINEATGNTNGSIDDVWKLYITDVLGYEYVGQHPWNYGLTFDDGNMRSLPAWWPEAQPLPQIRATGATWNGMGDPTAGLYASVANTVDAALPYFETAGAAQARWQFGFQAASPDYQIDLPRNSYIESAEITFSVLHVGSSFAGAKLYLKKVEMETTQVIGNDIGNWIADGKLTTAFVDLTTANTAVGDSTYDVKALIEEAMSGAASEWQDSNQILQFILVPNTATTTSDEYGSDNLVIDRYDAALPGSTAEKWTTRLNVTAITNTGNYETAPTHDSTIFHFIPVTAADAASTTTLRTVAPTDLSGGRASYSLTSAAWDPPGNLDFGVTGDTNALTLSMNNQIAELPPDSWNPDGSGQKWIFGEAYHENAAFTFFGALDGWYLSLRDRSYMFMTAGQWESDTSLGGTWDCHNDDGFSATSSVNGASSSFRHRLRANTSTLLGDGTTIPITATPAPGRRVQYALLWDHSTTRWRWWVKISDSAGVTLQEFTGSVVETPTQGANLGFRAFIGYYIRMVKMYGQMWVEWETPITSVWRDIAARQTELWVRGIKSIDPRIMV